MRLLINISRSRNADTGAAQSSGVARSSATNSRAAALREAEEEVGLAPDLVEVLGLLPDYLTGSAFRITPVVALVRPDYEPRPNPHEVADLFEVPLAFLMDPAHHRRQGLDWEGRRHEWFAMPYLQDGAERYIWGATAGMLRNLYHFLAA
ncbi:CoA pyrophosphatase [Malikia spinosa]|uniref:CoA pyrophosphatase n=1 Tax=Malikia spinosa TaxID=86180 RepID=A0A7C9J4D4_9BURK|nr:CoA pyrophosphatase [Malikia spinosa]